MYRIVWLLLLIFLGSCQENEEKMSEISYLMDEEEEEAEMLGELKQEQVAGEFLPVAQELMLDEEAAQH